MIINLTYEDITNGVINSRTSDPLALAAQRAGLTRPRVGRTTISWEEPVYATLPSTDGRTFEQIRVGVERVYAPLPDNAIRLLDRLTYEPREEILPCIVKRNKKGDVTSIAHKPMGILIGEGSAQEVAA